MSRIIERAIERHGARAVYEAAMTRFAGQGQEALNAVGLGADTLGDAHEIAGIAYERMSASERTKDYWQAMTDLNRLADKDQPK